MDRKFLNDLPPETVVTIDIACQIVGRSRSTVYRWADLGLLQPRSTPDGMMVTVGELMIAEAGIKKGRPRHKKQEM
jgi:predicted site-specific integrase-resolvase